MKKSAALLGLGTDNILSVKTDDKGKMVPADVEAKIEQAKQDVCHFEICILTNKALNKETNE